MTTAGKVRLSNLRADSWAQIEKQLREGKKPALQKLESALRRGDENIPAIVQLLLADLITRKAKLTPGPKSLPHQKAWVAYVLVNRINRWTRVFELRKRVNAPREAAFLKVASERGWDRDTVVKYYNKAKSTLKSSSALWLGGQN